MRKRCFSVFNFLMCSIFTVLLLGTLAESAEVIYYVADHGSDANTGLSSEVPFQTIQHAIDTANGSTSDPVTIRIAAGIYNEQVVMDSHESLEGGWDASFSARRNFSNSEFDSDPTIASIIDGESFRRCMAINNAEGVRINGLTFQHGWSDDGSEQSDIWDDTGAGVNCIASSVSFYNCSFLDNTAFSSGSGLHSIDSWVRVNGCRFNSNLCDSATMGGGGGGALYHSGGTLKVENSDFTYNEAYYNSVGAIFNDSDDGWIKGCRFSHNGGIEGHSGKGVESGAALLNSGPTAFIANCLFEHNHAEHFGAMRNWGSDVTIINSLFHDNTTEEGWPGGGALQNVDSNVSAYNSTFVDNVEYFPGTGIWGGHIGNYSSSLEVFNSIFWFHKEWLEQLVPGANISPAILNSDSTTIVYHSIIDDDDYKGVDGNIGTDPMFIADDNFRLQAQSPCKDAGSTEFPLPPDTADIDNDGDKTETIPIDLDGNSRISGDIVDIGAYEYVHPTGSLKVTYGPSGVVPNGKWRVDGGEWHPGGYTQAGLSVGGHEVEFIAVDGWITPSNLTVDIKAGETTTIDGQYQQTGSLKVSINPPEAVSAGVAWRVANGDWHPSGYSQSGLSEGTYRVEFKTISGWTAPGDMQVAVEGGETTTISGIYVLQTGSLKVSIEPSAAAFAGAQWRLGSDNWHDSGETQSGIPVGSHTVEFSSVSGWAKPGNQLITINNNETAQSIGTYTQETGSLTVTISPSEAISAGAQWRVDAGTWRDSGSTESALSVGDHRIDFKDVSGWVVPGSQTVSIKEDETTTLSGAYAVAPVSDTTGSLKVTITPTEAVSAGAQWRIAGDVTWRDSDEIQNGIESGIYQVEFKDIVNWEGPYNQTVTISDGATTNASGNYTQLTSVEDSDLDGISDDEEDSGPNGGDGNGDGIPDSQQANVTTLQTADTQMITLETISGVNIRNCKAVETSSVGSTPSGFDFPYGFFEFSLVGVDPGTSVSVTLIFPDSETFDAYYKFGPTDANAVDHWYDFMFDGETGAVIDGNRITLHFIDGQRGDDDLAANGTMVDIGGPGVSAVTPGGGSSDTQNDTGSGGGGGGCFIGTIQR